MRIVPWYTVRSKSQWDMYSVFKFDDDYNLLDTYEVGYKPRHYTCTCAGGHRWCRHKQIVRLFLRTNMVDSGYFYSYDQKKWQKCIQLQL